MTTALLTEQAVAEAEAAAQQAERDHQAARRAYAGNSASMSKFAELNRAAEVAAGVTGRARALRAVYDEQQAEREQRAALLRAAEEKLAPTAVQLVTTRDAAVTALAEAQRAMDRALAAVAEHDRLVRDTAAELKAGSWRTENGETTGCGLGGALHLAGERWGLVDGPGLLGAILSARVAVANPHHPLGRQRWSLYSAVTTHGRADLLSRVAASS